MLECARIRVCERGVERVLGEKGKRVLMPFPFG